MSSIHKAEKVVLIRELEQRHQLDTGYLARHFTRCHFPMTNPKVLADPTTWERRDGDRVLRLVADRRYGLPYGSDLLALYGLCTKGRELYKRFKGDWDGVVSFRSTAEMLRYFGDPPLKQYYVRRMKSLLRIWGTRVHIEEVWDRRGRAEQRHHDKADFLRSITAWFQLEERQLGMPFENVIQFTPEMVEWIRQAPAFEDQKIFLLRQSVGMLQLYLLLRDRCAQKDLVDKDYSLIPIHGPNSLESQLGWVKLPKPRMVRWQLAQWLKGIRGSVWPDCPGEIWQGHDGYWRLKVWYIPPLFR